MSIIEAYLQGKRARKIEQQEQRQSAMDQYLRGNSQGIMSGDPAAYAGLAQHNPVMAIQLQGQQRSQRYADNRERRAAETHDAAMRAQQEQAAMARFHAGLKQVLSLPDTPEGRAEFDRLAQSDPMTAQYVGQFDNRVDIVRGLVETVEDKLDRMSGQNRETKKDANGRLRYLETGELVFADVIPEPSPGNDYERYAARERAAGREPLDEFGYRGRIAETQAPLVQQNFGGNAPDPSALPDAAVDLKPSDYKTAFGLWETIGGAASRGSDSAFGTQLTPIRDAAADKVSNMNTEAMLIGASGFPGRPSNLTREKIEDMLPKPGVMGDGRARNKSREFAELSISRIKEADQLLSDASIKPEDKAEIARLRSQWMRLYEFYAMLTRGLGEETPTGETGGVQWRIVE
ncbi:MAG: hypothetical protein ACFB01_07160 [Cohaesibacteraceae bacterium]